MTSSEGRPGPIPRPIRADEIEAVDRLKARVYGSEYSPANHEISVLVAEPGRTFVVEDTDGMYATGGAFSFLSSVPGGSDVGTCGIRGIGVQATHRRRGTLRSLMRALLDQAHERGEALSCLWATESPIYGRFGFGRGVTHHQWEIERPYNGFRADVGGPAHTIRYAVADDLESMAGATYEAARRQVPGMLARDDRWWRRIRHHHGQPQAIEAIDPATGAQVGYALFRVTYEWSRYGPDNRLEVGELVALTGAAERDLWRFLFDIDLVMHVSAWGRPVDELLPHLLADPRRMSRTLTEAAWVRLVDVTAALSARRWSADGTTVVEVRDDFCPWNAGRWTIAVDAGVADVVPTDAAPDLTLDVAHLGAAYFGATRLCDLARAGLVDEHTAGAAAALDRRLWWPRAPWAVTWF